MKDIEQRTVEIAEYILTHKSTIRKTASIFGISKSTVHFDLSKRLPYIDFEMYKNVRQVLNQNFQEKNIRGGYATKMFHLKQRLGNLHKKSD